MATRKAKGAGHIVPEERIAQGILMIRGHKVMVDADLANLYGVTTKRLNEQVKRNRERFPDDFMFQLTAEEKEQVVANCDHLARLKFSPAIPNVFTEHGAIMAASVLNTPRAVEMSVYVVRAFIRLRHDCRDAGGRATQEQLPGCSPPTRSSQGSSPRLKGNMTPSSRWCSTPSAN
jgi:hypothetical protein